MAGTGVVILDKDGSRVVELDSRGNMSVVHAPTIDERVITSGDNAGAAQNGTVFWTPESGKKIHLDGLLLSTGTAGAIKINMGATTIFPNTYLAQNTSVVITGPKEIWVAVSGDSKLEYTSTIAGNHSVTGWGVEV